MCIPRISCGRIFVGLSKHKAQIHHEASVVCLCRHPFRAAICLTDAIPTEPVVQAVDLPDYKDDNEPDELEDTDAQPAHNDRVCFSEVCWDTQFRIWVVGAIPVEPVSVDLPDYEGDNEADELEDTEAQPAHTDGVCFQTSVGTSSSAFGL